MPAEKFNYISGILLILTAVFILFAESCVQEYENDKTAVLPRYKRSAPRLKLKNVRNASGITYCNDTKTLFVVQDSPPKIIEITEKGKILRRIEIEGLKDIEGIAYLGNNRFVIADEHSGTVYFLSLKPDTKYITKKDMAPLNLNLKNSPEHGISGITYNSNDKSLFIVTEKEPKRIIQVFIGSEKQNIPWNLEKSETQDADGIFFDPHSEHLFIISKSAASVVEYSLQGKKLSQIYLKKGNNNLKHNIEKPEGITMNSSGRKLFICGEKNDFFTFSLTESDNRNK
jgi:uncharacterized protein YjiK